MTAAPRADARAVPARDVLKHPSKAVCAEDAFHVRATAWQKPN